MCCLSNVNILAVFAQNPVNALSCAFFPYFVLRMNQKVSGSNVGHYGRGDAMLFFFLFCAYTLATASETPLLDVQNHPDVLE